MARYRITYSPLSGAYKIMDEHMGGTYCALPNRDGVLVQLRFRTGEQARDWLATCQRMWQTREDRAERRVHEDRKEVSA